MKDVGSQIVKTSEQGVNNSDDYWNKIIMNNVDQFYKEQDLDKQRIKEN